MKTDIDCHWKDLTGISEKNTLKQSKPHSAKLHFKLIETHYITSSHMVLLLTFRPHAWYDVLEPHLELTTCVCYSASIIIAKQSMST